MIWLLRPLPSRGGRLALTVAVDVTRTVCARSSIIAQPDVCCAAELEQHLVTHLSAATSR
jgi:hypothetical protein